MFTMCVFGRMEFTFGNDCKFRKIFGVNFGGGMYTNCVVGRVEFIFGKGCIILSKDRKGV